MRVVPAALALMFLALATAPVPGQGGVEVKVVKYDQLGDIVRQFKGKVVVVDFWADT